MMHKLLPSSAKEVGSPLGGQRVMALTATVQPPQPEGLWSRLTGRAPTHHSHDDDQDGSTEGGVLHTSWQYLTAPYHAVWGTVAGAGGPGGGGLTPLRGGEGGRQAMRAVCGPAAAPAKPGLMDRARGTVREAADVVPSRVQGAAAAVRGTVGNAWETVTSRLGRAASNDDDNDNDDDEGYTAQLKHGAQRAYDGAKQAAEATWADVRRGAHRALRDESEGDADVGWPAGRRPRHLAHASWLKSALWPMPSVRAKGCACPCGVGRAHLGCEWYRMTQPSGILHQAAAPRTGRPALPRTRPRGVCARRRSGSGCCGPRPRCVTVCGRPCPPRNAHTLLWDGRTRSAWSRTRRGSHGRRF
jgi:hypothetical protein